MITKRKKYLYLLIFWLAVTFILTSLPGSRITTGIRHMDKVAHFIIYAISGYLFASYLREGNLPARLVIIYTVLLIGFVGGIDEIHQRWITGRVSSLFDWMADISGGGLSAVIVVMARRAGISLPLL